MFSRATGFLLVTFAAAAVAVGCGGDSTETTRTISPTTTTTTTTTTTVIASATVEATATHAAPTATATAIGPRQIVLDPSAKPQPPEVTGILGQPPASVFPAWNGKSVVVYDVQTGKAIDLGPGTQPASFSPDETKATWASGGEFANGTEVFVADLPSGQKRSLGPGRFAQFYDNTHVLVSAIGSNDSTLVDVASGSGKPFSGDRPRPFNPDHSSAPAGYSIKPDGYTGPEVRSYALRNGAGVTVLTFDAVAVSAAGPGELAVVAPPANGRSNIYLLEIATGKATFVATALPGKDNFPFSASAESILWTDNYCGPATSARTPAGPISLFDRKTGNLARIDPSSVANPGTDIRGVRLTPSGLIAAGSFGAKYLIDPATLEYKAVIPGRPDGYGGDVSWSSGFRYASHGPYGGHGGLCSGE